MRFPQGLFPLGLFIVSAFSSRWLEDQHAGVQRDLRPRVSSTSATWKPGNRRILLSSLAANPERKGSFSGQLADLGTLVPGSLARTPRRPPAPARLARAPSQPGLLGLPGGSSSLPFPPAKPGLTQSFISSPGGSQVAFLCPEGTTLPRAGP